MPRTTSDQILSAARNLFVKYGLRRTSLDDIAVAAGIGRATLFRRYQNRDALVAALVDKELAAALAKIDTAINKAIGPEDQFIAGFLSFMNMVRTNELLHELLQSDAETVLPLLTTAGHDVIAIARLFAQNRLEIIRDSGAPLTADPEYLAEILARIGHSLAMTPQTVLPIHDEQAMAAFARTSLIPLVFK
ncbi:MAG: helix-turn-helix domain-containing protein [Alphaproteobacteria bacterium]